MDGRPQGPGGALQVPRRTDGPHAGRTAGYRMHLGQGQGATLSLGRNQLGTDTGNPGHGRSPTKRTDRLLPASCQGPQPNGGTSGETEGDKRGQRTELLSPLRRLWGNKSPKNKLLGKGPLLQHLREDRAHREGLQNPSCGHPRSRRESAGLQQRGQRNLLTTRIHRRHLPSGRSSGDDDGSHPCPRCRTKMLGRGGGLERNLLGGGFHGGRLWCGPIDTTAGGLRQPEAHHASWPSTQTAELRSAAHRGSPGHSQDQGAVPRARSRCSTLHRPQQLLISHGEEPPGTPCKPSYSAAVGR